MIHQVVNKRNENVFMSFVKFRVLLTQETKICLIDWLIGWSIEKITSVQSPQLLLQVATLKIQTNVNRLIALTNFLLYKLLSSFRKDNLNFWRHLKAFVKSLELQPK